MLHCWSEDEEAYALPQDVDEPKTIWWMRRKAIRNDDWMLVQAAMSRLRVAMTGQGREVDDPFTIAKANGLERQAVVRLVTRVQNVREPGDQVDRPEQILALLEEMPFGAYQTLVAHAIGTQSLTPLERKPSGSPSEGGQPSETPSDSATGTPQTP
mgnify:CR=1 FL=1